MKKGWAIFLGVTGLLLFFVGLWLFLNQQNKNEEHEATDERQQQQINGLAQAVNNLHQRTEQNKLGVQYVMNSMEQQQPHDKKPVVVQGFRREEKKVS